MGAFFLDLNVSINNVTDVLDPIYIYIDQIPGKIISWTMPPFATIVMEYPGLNEAEYSISK